MVIYNAQSFSLGFISDSHNNNENIDKILNKHPEITEWFFLGDIVSFLHPTCLKNGETSEWYFKNKDKFKGFVKGNHDHSVAQQLNNVEHAFAWELAKFEKHIRVYLPDATKLELFHSKPNDFWEFVDVGYSEKEFLDDYDKFIDDYTRAMVIGHSHRQHKISFPYTEPEIWSVGACVDGYYALTCRKLNNLGNEYTDIEFKKI